MHSIPFSQKLTATIPETVACTGLGRTKLYEQIAAGRIRTTQVGRRRLVIVASVIELLDPAAVAAAPRSEAA